MLNKNIFAFNKLMQPAYTDPFENIRKICDPFYHFQSSSMATVSSFQSLSSPCGSVGVTGGISAIARELAKTHSPWQGAIGSEHLGVIPVGSLFSESAALNAAEPSIGIAGFGNGAKSSLMTDIANAGIHLKSLFEQETSSIRLMRDLMEKQDSTVESTRPLYADASRFMEIEKSASLALKNMSLGLSATGKLMASLDFGAIGRHHGIETTFFADVENSLATLDSAYGNFVASFDSMAALRRYPDFVLPGATSEMFTTGAVLHSLMPEEKAEIEWPEGANPDLTMLLEHGFADLIPIYRGILESINSHNPERKRHILTSIRTLCDAVLHRLAPNNYVIPWITESQRQKELMDKGKPIRAARIKYICRDLEDTPLAKFMEADSDAFPKIYEVLNRLHELKIGLNERQLKIVVKRIEAYLVYLLQFSSTVWN